MVTITQMRIEAEKLSRKYGYACTVVVRNKKSVMPWISPDRNYAIFLIVPKNERGALIDKKHLIGEKEPAFFTVQPINEAIETLRTALPKMDNGVVGLREYTSFLFHTPIYGNYPKHLKQTVETTMPDELREAIDKYYKTMQLTTPKERKTLIRARTENEEREKKLIGGIEQKEVINRIAKSPYS